MKNFFRLGIVTLAMILTTWAFLLPKPQAASPALEPDQIIETISEESLAKAIPLYEAAVQTDPENYDLRWKTARAYCLLLDLKTDELIEEKDEYKPLLAEYGSKAENHGNAAYRINPKGPDGLVWYAGSMAYHAASQGILKGITSGRGFKVKRLAEELQRVDDAYHGAFAYRLLGRFYLKAPFPIGTKGKAVKFLSQAVEKAPTDLQNHFFLGEALNAKSRHEEAREHYRYVLDNPPHEIEIHLDAALKRAAKKRLETGKG